MASPKATRGKSKGGAKTEPGFAIENAMMMGGSVTLECKKSKTQQL